MMVDFASNEFAPNNPPLWQVALAASMRHHQLPHDAWRVRADAVEFYTEYGGEFRNDNPMQDVGNHPGKALVANLFSNQGLELTASLLSRSMNYQWRQYIGASPVELADVESPASFPLRRNDYFGIRASPLAGYDIMLPRRRNMRIIITAHAGHTLMSLSRVLSFREARYRDAAL